MRATYPGALVSKRHPMARTVTAIAVTLLPREAGLAVLPRLHEWLVSTASCAAAAWAESAGVIHAACKLKRPQRLARVKQAVCRAVCGPEDVLHVAAAEDALLECARVIDGAGGLAYSAAPPHPSAPEPTPASERVAVAKAPHALLLHGLTVGNVLAGRHALWSSQRDAGVLRPLPLSRALEAVVARVDASSMRPVAHACESPEVLAERYQEPEALVHVPWYDRLHQPKPGCPLCWRNQSLARALGPGHVCAAIPALYAAGYDAGHLRLRHAEHGLARVVTDVLRRDGKKRARHE